MDGSRTLTQEMQDIDAVISRYKGKHGELLGILEESQILNEHKYLSEEALNHVALRTGVPLSRVYNVVTFYSFFNLKPQGKHTITVCRGTACHTKGSRTLLD
ncbi:MAG TPA: NAD(P)H-dependent oxidoreductase subunit E, partial [Bacteroidetes bacterium]|nr:NAD(P)H-dependent oxidoreductase subunit E [Bacteroidota bacterium]